MSASIIRPCHQTLFQDIPSLSLQLVASEWYGANLRQMLDLEGSGQGGADPTLTPLLNLSSGVVWGHCRIGG
jgi:hypothetical protein